MSPGMLCVCVIERIAAHPIMLRRSFCCSRIRATMAKQRIFGAAVVCDAHQRTHALQPCKTEQAC